MERSLSAAECDGALVFFIKPTSSLPVLQIPSCSTRQTTIVRTGSWTGPPWKLRALAPLPRIQPSYFLPLEPFLPEVGPAADKARKEQLKSFNTHLKHGASQGQNLALTRTLCSASFDSGKGLFVPGKGDRVLGGRVHLHFQSQFWMKSILEIWGNHAERENPIHLTKAGFVPRINFLIETSRSEMSTCGLGWTAD